MDMIAFILCKVKVLCGWDLLLATMGVLGNSPIGENFASLAFKVLLGMVLVSIHLNLPIPYFFRV
jgi:hypothetical protein